MSMKLCQSFVKSRSLTRRSLSSLTGNAMVAPVYPHNTRFRAGVFLTSARAGFVRGGTFGPARFQKIAISKRNYFERDFFRTHGRTFPDIGAASKFLRVHLSNHVKDALIAFRLSLR